MEINKIVSKKRDLARYYHRGETLPVTSRTEDKFFFVDLNILQAIHILQPDLCKDESTRFDSKCHCRPRHFY